MIAAAFLVSTMGAFGFGPERCPTAADLQDEIVFVDKPAKAT
ncbi:MAG: hypothetical protein AAF761_05430 [Pseudomonadota bacterium]